MAKGRRDRIKVGISGGDVNGIGLEVVFKTFRDQRMMELCTPVLYTNFKLALAYKKAMGLKEVDLFRIEKAADAKSKKLNVIDIAADDTRLEWGSPDTATGQLARLSLERAVNDMADNTTDVLVTAPINKNTIHSEAFPFEGHTEYLANYANEENPLMILVNEGLRVGLVTGHVPVKQVSETLSVDRIVSKLEVFNKSLLADFNIPSPKLAVLGLNPHAGDNGLLGEEEKTIIGPAIEKANEMGIRAFGPFAADGFFGSNGYKSFDGVLAMYHDQGLAPFKALSFNAGVNFTAGLPIVRTSPDHGTGYDIAGKDMASEASFRTAVYAALDIFDSRRAYRELVKDPLKSYAKKR